MNLNGKYELSSIYLDSAISINPKDYKYHELKGRNNYYLYDYKKAIISFNQAIILNPKSGWSYLLKAYSKNNLEDFRGAIIDIDKAIPLLVQAKANNESIAEAYLNRSYSNSSIGKFNASIIDCNLAISYNKNYAKAYYNKGMALIKLGQIENGCIALSKAGELGFDLAYDAIKENCN
jgi:tetratricopeptide (TPR) repeat protein